MMLASTFIKYDTVDDSLTSDSSIIMTRLMSVNHPCILFNSKYESGGTIEPPGCTIVLPGGTIVLPHSTIVPPLESDNLSASSFSIIRHA